MREDGILINGYGPTENATFTCCHTMRKGEVIAGTVLIGRPINNTQVFVLDQELQPVPLGVAGELHIGGAGLARGYEGDAALTAEKLVPHPYGQAGERLYRSGDKVRYQADGTLEFVGRKDRQVKVRGYRVEPGEIEWALRQNQAVRDVVVAVQEVNRGKSLIAYVVMDANQELSSSDLQSYLRTTLPDYMSPAAFVFLEKLPLTSNGKVDLKALPKPEASGMPGGVILPRTPIEHGITEIWRQVFGRENLSINDNFFDLGGHSLLALQVASRVRSVLGVSLPLRSIFEEPTIADQARVVEKLISSEEATTHERIRPFARPEIVPLSFAQQRLWFLHQLEPASDFYNVPLAFRIDGPLNITILNDCCNEILRRHEALRTTFPIRQGIPVQQINGNAYEPMTIIDLAHLPLEEAESSAKDLLSREAQQPFDLSCGPLLRLHVVRLAEDDHVLLLNMHHIIVDGWSLGIFMQELGSLYTALLHGSSPSSLPVLPIQYADYALWQREWLNGERIEYELTYWRQQVSDVSVLELPTDFPRPKVQTFRGAKRSILVPPRLQESLTELAHRENSTVFMTLLAALKMLMNRYTSQPDITVGTPVAGRNQQELESLIGFFVNTLVLRARVLGQPSFTQFLSQVREVSLGAYSHQELPFERIVEDLRSQTEPGRTPFFQVMFALEDTLIQEVALPGLRISPIELETRSTQFDLMVAMRPSPEGLPISFQYNTDLFEEATMERMMRHFQQLLRGVVADPSQPIAEISLLEEQERRQVLVEWNQTRREYAPYETVLDLLEQQARATPENPAVLFEAKQLSYRELHEQANQLAHSLNKMGVGPEVRVGVCMERSAELVIALLGILKSGGAYVPLDPSYPAERLNHMLEDARITVLLADRHLTEKLKDAGERTRFICLQEQWESIGRESKQAPESRVNRDNLVYLIYTSGSTGQPKGVMSVHRGLLNRLQWMQEAYRLDETDRVLQKTPFGFDVSVWEFFWPLMTGACLVVAGAEGHKDSRYLVETIQREKVTTLHFVPSMLQVFLQEKGVEGCGSLRRVISSGEALPLPLVQEFQKRLSAKLHNLYGPTEASIDVSYWECERPMKRPSVPIGRPIANIELYILDSQLQPVPVGINGELHIGGAGLARGYWGRAELTAEKFIPDSFCGEAGARLYRTGDLARWRADGMIEYLGRLDNQIKLRGFRIEIGEIEAVLTQHPDVSQAVVVLKDDGEQRLVGYVVVGNSTGESHVHDIREYLRTRLPEYMVPAIVQLEKITLTANGKTDYNALAAASSVDHSGTHSYVAPRSAIEEQIAKACCDLLGIQRIGIHDNFFDSGGHSLLAMRLMTWIRETFQVETVPLRGFFETPTVAGLAALTIKCEPRPGQTEKIANFL